ncbi:MAG: DNA pilot protein [Arizlama microvirus]|nr:MAG: DNA pilot protein [Arizlama microvirus]
MGFLDSVIDGFTGGIGSTVLGLGSSLFGNFLNKNNAQDAFENSQSAARESAAFNAEQYAKRFQTSAADMRKAGLNPILAAGGGFSGGGAPTMSSAQSFQAAPVQDITSSAKNLSEMNRTITDEKRLLAETENVIEDTKKKSAETLNTIQDTLKKREETGLAKANERNAVQQLTNLQWEALKSAETVKLLKEQTLQAATQAGLNQAQKWQAIENEKKIKQETANLQKQYKLLEADVKRVQAIDDVYGNDAGALLTIMRETMRSLLGK